MKQQYHYIYKITLLLGKLAGYYYYGKRTIHKDLGPITPEEDVNYTGSGKIIKNYFKKYKDIKQEGVTHIKEIIETNPDKYTNAEREKVYVDTHLDDPMCINIAKGGFGGGSPGHEVSQETRKKISERLVGNPKLRHIGVDHPMYGKHHSEETRKKLSESHKGKTHTLSAKDRKKISERMKGIVIPPETRKKISDTLKGNICWNKMEGAQSRYIKQTDMEGNVIKIWDLETECFTTYGYRLSHVKSCCDGERKTHKKCFWEWVKIA